MIFWIRSHIQPVMLFLGAVALSLKPEVVGTSHYGTVGWLTVGLTVGGAVTSYIVPNLEGAALVDVKDVVVILTAGFAAAINVAPNGFSRADVWTIGEAAVVVAVPFLFPSKAVAAVQSGGPGHMGDHLKGV